MGSQTNKPEEQKNDISMEIVLDKGVKQQIDKLSEYISLFNSNDVKPLLQVVKDYKINLETSTGKTFDLNNIDTVLSKFHKELLNKISRDYPELNEQEKASKVSETLKDKGLSEYLRTIYDDKLGVLKEQILKNPVVSKDTQVASSIQNIFTDITGLKSKYKYFEYRYIQLNLFLIVFIEHTYSTMENFINTVLSYTVTRDKMRQDSLKELINLLLRIMREAELDIDQKDFETIDQLMSVIKKQIKNKQVKLGEAVEKAKVGALDEMMKLITANHNIYDDDSGSISKDAGQKAVGQKAVGQKAATQNVSPNASLKNAVQTVSPDEIFLEDASQKLAAKNSQKLAAKNSQKSDGQFGGFVRDHSRFPQAFYDLSKV
jgi:hypothetical protein